MGRKTHNETVFAFYPGLFFSLPPFRLASHSIFSAGSALGTKGDTFFFVMVHMKTKVKREDWWGLNYIAICYVYIK